MINFKVDFAKHIAAIYRKSGYLHGISEINAKEFDSFFSLNKEIALLCANTEAFLFKNLGVNTLLYGARGCGKSSLIKAMLKKYHKNGLRVVQIDKDFLENMPEILDFLSTQAYKFIIFCDDLSFEKDDKSYKSLKSILEGGIESMPLNIRFYATSNRRKLLPEFHDENEISGYEGDEDKNALSDRFPLCIGFYTYGSADFLGVLREYFKGVQDFSEIEKKAMRYATQKGSKNPRTAAQFYELYKSGLLEFL